MCGGLVAAREAGLSGFCSRESFSYVFVRKCITAPVLHQHRVQTTTARTHSPPDNPRALHVSQLRISRDPSTTGPNAHSARPLSFSRLAALSHPREPETRDTAQLSLAPQADPRKQSNTRNNNSPAPIPERNDTNRHQYSPKAATPSQQHILLIFSKPGLQQTATTPLRRHNTQHQNVLISSTTQHKRRHQRQQTNRRAYTLPSQGSSI